MAYLAVGVPGPRPSVHPTSHKQGTGSERQRSYAECAQYMLVNTDDGLVKYATCGSQPQLYEGSVTAVAQLMSRDHNRPQHNSGTCCCGLNKAFADIHELPPHASLLKVQHHSDTVVICPGFREKAAGQLWLSKHSPAHRSFSCGG
jgi:hypothetical protein